MNVKKLMSMLLVVVMVLSMAACNGAVTADTTVPTTDGTAAGAVTTYKVSVTTAGGMAMSGVSVYVYDAATQSEMKGFGETDAEGNASIELPQGEYVVKLESGIPNGYNLESSYAFSGTVADIVLTSQLIADGNLSEVKLGLGDVMYDFTVTASDGSTVTLSEMLQEKEMVLLNFWYTSCTWCVQEFPYMQEVYENYQDKVGIIALDPYPEAIEDVAYFKGNMGLTFPMATCPAAWANTFGVEGYPTSVIVDRYGVICLVESGALIGKSPFTTIFEHFTGDDYEQKLCPNGVADIYTVMKPTTTMPSSEEIAAVVSNGVEGITYENAGESDLEYNWPFVIGEYNGEPCIQSSNKEIESSYSILRIKAELKAGQALSMDYLTSTEAGNDVLHVIVDDRPVYTIGGADENPVWQTMTPCVAETDGTYTISLCYIKNSDTNVGDDTVYLKNIKIISADEVTTETFLSRQAATTEDGFTYNYVDIFLNEDDGYYHVGSENGPLLLANLMGTSQFNEEESIWTLVYKSGLTVDGVDYAARLEQYANYSNHSNLAGFCTVTEELATLLQAADTLYGFDTEDTNEWLRCCEYYQSYGANGKQLEDPVAGLAPFSAFEAKLGKNISTNYFYYNRVIMPRGMFAEFTPKKTGVYRISTHDTEAIEYPLAWVFDENRNELAGYERPDERAFFLEHDSEYFEAVMYCYMEAGTPYYINIAFGNNSIEQVGTIYYDIEYVGKTYESFRICSPGYFTYDSDATGDAMYRTIAGGIDVVLGEDGIYYEDLGDGKKGSKIYCDFTGLTGVISHPISSSQAVDENGKKLYDENGDPVMVKGLIDLGKFDFSKDEYDDEILAYMAMNDNDPDKTREYLKAMWGTSYDEYAELYKVEEVLAGKYHGTGEDMTEVMRAFEKQIIKSGAKERRGCVVVTEDLAEALQMLMDKYTFAGVDHSWTKLCYYYDDIVEKEIN